LFLAYVLLYPNIRFSFNSEKKKIIFPVSTREQRYNQIFGIDINNKTITDVWNIMQECMDRYEPKNKLY
jgi:cytidylate kinase